MAFLLVLMSGQAVWAMGTPAGTIIRNAAFATFNSVDGIAMPRTVSNEVTTIVRQVAGVDVTPERSRHEVGPGSAAIIPVQITNIGNGPDTYDVTKLGIPADWTHVPYKDINRNGLLDPVEATDGNILTETETLPADSIQYVVIAVTPPLLLR